MIKIFSVPSTMAGQRLDETLAQLAGISKGEARRVIDRGGCAVNQSMVRVASRRVKVGDALTAGLMQPGEFRELHLGSEAIIYQDSDLLAVNKPCGIASQRTPYQLKGTLEYWVAEEFARQGIREPVRVVHRLDRGTSGLMLFPKHRQSAAWLSDLFKQGTIQKRYLAVVTGTPLQQTWVADGPIGKVGAARWGVVSEGRSALTEFRLLVRNNEFTLIEALPRTGRTHQIRVHLAAAGLPIVGDCTYGGVQAERMLLHCHELAFTNKNGTPLRFCAEPDEVFCRLYGVSRMNLS
jgi:RluA family pseudouridine synthase